MRSLAVIAIAVCAGVSGACSGAFEGESERPGYRGHAYLPTDAERAFDCAAFAFTVDRSVKAINAMPAQAKAQRDGPPSSVVHAMQRVAGNGIPVLEDYKRERARLKTLTELSAAKGCPVIDVEEQIKDATQKLVSFRRDIRGE